MTFVAWSRQLPASPQRLSFSSALVEAVHRNLRLLEHTVTGPIGLTTDIKSLREAMPQTSAREERDRLAFQDISLTGSRPKQIGLAARNLIVDTLELLALTASDGSEALPLEWRNRTAKVLDRVHERLGGDIRPDTAASIAGVYVIVDPEHTNDRPVTLVAEAAVRGGAAAVQYRDKKSEKGVVLSTAREVVSICRKAGAVSIINDYADIAVLAGADGLHVGQRDIPVREARRILAGPQIIGKSNALLQEALEAEAEGADYIAIGAMFPTKTKQNTRPAGVETLKQVKRAVAAPVIAIGGINIGNVAQVAAAGADAICVASAVTRDADPETATRRLVAAFSSAGKK